MTRQLFGTDGIRGLANREPMTAETAMRVAMATALQFRRGDHRHLVVIGKDTRLSGYLLEPAMTAGFVSMGLDVVILGPVPTPGVAMLTRSLRADLGVVISASHNPYVDNGIKLFGPDGFKLSDEVESAIEHRLSEDMESFRADPTALGRARRLDDALGRYIEYVKATFPKGRRLDGLKVVVDCAHGAAYKVAPTVLWELGADVVTIGASPDGTNINHDVGATAPAAMQAAVVDTGADLGIALDGDADRVILADEKGVLIDGDQVMALVAADYFGPTPSQATVVATVMSNLGLERYLAQQGISLIRTPVGDRYVVERMREGGFPIGGEQSGHIVLGDHSTTGDGLIAALRVLSLLQNTRRPASEICRPFVPVPQLLRNVTVDAGADPLTMPHVVDTIDAARAHLGARGRIVVRKSGTEPKIRVMAEGDDPAEIETVVGSICEAVTRTGSEAAE